MTEQDLIHKIEWVNKRCSLRGEPLTQHQIELLMFVFADTVVNKIVAKPVLCGDSEQLVCESCGESALNGYKTITGDVCLKCSGI